MQLGTRWNVGGEPPARLPEQVVAAVAEVEAELEGVDTANWRWTLTWLEGRPVVELDDGTVIRVDYEGNVVTTRED
ncbi:hypothetical protein [Galbitalea soli]|uniref:PepSY domain-containing protein n=1 Tax=Galbitalea soli TaxID=1268042 RepID=A0A7C9PNT4_9MICO|nr:hypothetical protein [Galbitalea soli]NEM91706.1 hypothetical protein [Galbitalea soli]NYJ30402.1 hypothetical protein [Galbitalea soli]